MRTALEGAATFLVRNGFDYEQIMGWDGWDFETLASISMEARAQHLADTRIQLLGMAAAVQSIMDKKALDAFLKLLEVKSEEAKPTPKPEKIRKMMNELNRLGTLLKQ